MRAMIVDDEELARQRLKRLLAAFPDVEVVGEAADGEEALQRVVELAPDLVFLDVQMPGLNGIEVAFSLPSPPPKIIFCTAYDEYALEAFEVAAAGNRGLLSRLAPGGGAARGGEGSGAPRRRPRRGADVERRQAGGQPAAVARPAAPAGGLKSPRRTSE